MKKIEKYSKEVQMIIIKIIEFFIIAISIVLGTYILLLIIKEIIKEFKK